MVCQFNFDTPFFKKLFFLTKNMKIFAPNEIFLSKSAMQKISLITNWFTNKYNYKIANYVCFLQNFIPLIFNKLENKNANFTLFMNR